jgi:hypothetical protein
MTNAYERWDSSGNSAGRVVVMGVAKHAHISKRNHPVGVWNSLFFQTQEHQGGDSRSVRRADGALVMEFRSV